MNNTTLNISSDMSTRHQQKYTVDLFVQCKLYYANVTFSCTRIIIIVIKSSLHIHP